MNPDDKELAQWHEYVPPPRTLDTRVPPEWLELRPNLIDLLGTLQKRHGVAPDTAWHELVEARHERIAPLKLAYRLYVLIDSMGTHRLV